MRQCCEPWVAATHAIPSNADCRVMGEKIEAKRCPTCGSMIEREVVKAAPARPPASVRQTARPGKKRRKAKKT